MAELASSNFLVPNATFFVELAAFLIVLGVLAKWVLPVINKAMEDRQATLRQALADAEEAKARAAEAEEEYKRVISEARSQARALVDEANRLSEQLRAEKRQQAEEESDRIVTRAREDVEAQARKAFEDLRQQAADLAIAVAEKVVGEGIDAESHRNLIDRTISEIEAQAGAAGVTA
jgi:F-type H+-transporting ATPase subunit b